jgi:PLP dependent protein
MTIAARLQTVREHIAAATLRAGRMPQDVRLVAVSKLQPAAAIREAYAAGQRDFGENYVQEMVEKRAALADLADIRWHFIGHVQSRKAKELVLPDTLVHGVDSISAIRKLSAQALDRDLTVPVLLQVNPLAESTKAGATLDELDELCAGLVESRGLDWQGLMAIAPHTEDVAALRGFFRRVRELRDSLAGRWQRPLAELSMGMSDDMPYAIEEGATWVRVGTAIFGQRPVRV